jgi:hypothetical protein
MHDHQQLAHLLPLLDSSKCVTLHLLVVGARLGKVLVQLLHMLPHRLRQRLQLLQQLLRQLRLLPILSRVSSSCCVAVGVSCSSISCCICGRYVCSAGCCGCCWCCLAYAADALPIH